METLTSKHSPFLIGFSSPRQNSSSLDFKGENYRVDHRPVELDLDLYRILPLCIVFRLF